MQYLTHRTFFSSPFGKEKIHLPNSWGELGAGRKKPLKLFVDRPCEVRSRTPSPAAFRQVRDRGEKDARKIRMRAPALRDKNHDAGSGNLPAPSPQIVTRSHLKYAAPPSSYREQANIIPQNATLSSGLHYLKKAIKMATFRANQHA